jgi:N-methylhydantoinase A/oxoprolinase/acetone carboxylase beta subunit
VSADAGVQKRISRADIEAKLRDMRGEVQQTAEAAKTPILAIAGGVAAAVIVVAFLLGKRRGRRKSTVVEIRRV